MSIFKSKIQGSKYQIIPCYFDWICIIGFFPFSYIFCVSPIHVVDIDLVIMSFVHVQNLHQGHVLHANLLENKYKQSCG